MARRKKDLSEDAKLFYEICNLEHICDATEERINTLKGLVADYTQQLRDCEEYLELCDKKRIELSDKYKRLIHEETEKLLIEKQSWQ